MTECVIDTLDLNDFMAGRTRQTRFAEGIRSSLSTTGFFLLRNHGMSPVLVNRTFAVLPSFFRDLSQEQRERYALNDMVGYTPPRVEKGEGYSTPDEKHFFHVRDGVTLYVSELPLFTSMLVDINSNFKWLAALLLRAIALSLDLPQDYFVEAEGNSLLRALHYPENEYPVEHEHQLVDGGNLVGMCAAPHTDINMLTLLLAREAGLELEYEGEWLPITIEDSDVIIVNGADILRHLTGGRYRSARHRVVCKPGVERYSIPYFVHIKPETSIVPLSHLGESDLEEFHYQTAGEFIHARLVQLGVIQE